MSAVLAPSPTRRTDSSLIGQLNIEWDQLRAADSSAAMVTGWAARHAALAHCAMLDDVEDAVTGDADAVLLALLHETHNGDQLAGRTVVQLMLGKAVRIAGSHAGRAPLHDLEACAVTALWDVIATYPVARRPEKVAANIAMDTLNRVVAEFAHDRHEQAVSPDLLHPSHRDDDSGPADLDLLNLLAWAVDNDTITAADASLLVDMYVPAPGQTGGKTAAELHGMSWAAARQRASRAVRRITHAIYADTVG